MDLQDLYSGTRAGAYVAAPPVGRAATAAADVVTNNKHRLISCAIMRRMNYEDVRDTIEKEAKKAAFDAFAVALPEFMKTVSDMTETEISPYDFIRSVTNETESAAMAAMAAFNEQFTGDKSIALLATRNFKCAIERTLKIYHCCIAAIAEAAAELARKSDINNLMVDNINAELACTSYDRLAFPCTNLYLLIPTQSCRRRRQHQKMRK